MNKIRTSLERFQPVTPLTDDELRRKAARLWHERGTVMVRPEWLNNDFDRQHMMNVAEKMYGRREPAQ